MDEKKAEDVCSAVSDANRTAFFMSPKTFGQAVIDSLRTRGYDVVEQKFLVKLLAEWKK